MDRKPFHCPDCNVYDYNAEHICTVYDGPACRKCGEPTLFFVYAAPGYGQGRECKNRHVEHVGAYGELTPAMVR